MTKVCKVCNKELEITEFPTNGKYYKNTCKKCEYKQRNKYAKEYSPEQLKTETRVCATCGETKSLLKFTKNSTHKGGFYASCKECSSKRKVVHERKFKEGEVSGFTKKCKTCGEVLDLKFFSKAISNKDGLTNNCKRCLAVDHKRRRLAGKDKVNNFKSVNGCAKCGERRFYVLDFHHRDPLAKEYNISKLESSAYNKVLWDEIAKCEILCRNCHQEFHHLERTKGITLKEYLKEDFIDYK